MFKNQLALALRNLSKRKGFTIFNILGLTIGITLFRTINCESAVCNRQSAIANLQSPICNRITLRTPFCKNGCKVFRIEEQCYAGRILMPAPLRFF